MPEHSRIICLDDNDNDDNDGQGNKSGENNDVKGDKCQNKNNEKGEERDTIIIKKEMSAEDVFLERQTIAIFEGRCVDLTSPATAAAEGTTCIDLTSPACATFLEQKKNENVVVLIDSEEKKDDGEVVESCYCDANNEALSVDLKSEESKTKMRHADVQETVANNELQQQQQQQQSSNNINHTQQQDEEMKYNCLMCQTLFSQWIFCFQHMQLCCPEMVVGEHRRGLLNKCRIKRLQLQRCNHQSKNGTQCDAVTQTKGMDNHDSKTKQPCVMTTHKDDYDDDDDLGDLNDDDWELIRSCFTESAPLENSKGSDCVGRYNTRYGSRKQTLVVENEEPQKLQKENDDDDKSVAVVVGLESVPKKKRKLNDSTSIDTQQQEVMNKENDDELNDKTSTPTILNEEDKGKEEEEFRCLDCETTFPRWTLCYEHMKMCCPEKIRCKEGKYKHMRRINPIGEQHNLRERTQGATPTREAGNDDCNDNYVNSDGEDEEGKEDLEIEIKYECVACCTPFPQWDECLHHMKICCPEEAIDDDQQKLTCGNRRTLRNRDGVPYDSSAAETGTTSKMSYKQQSATSSNPLNAIEQSNKEPRNKLICPKCKEIFTKKRHKKKHMAVCCPTKIKGDYKCPECHLSFTVWKHCANHMKKCCPHHHSQKTSFDCCKSNNGSNTKNAFKCPQCNCIFSNWGVCLKHLKECIPGRSYKGFLKKCRIKNGTRDEKVSTSNTSPKAAQSTTTQPTNFHALLENKMRYTLTDLSSAPSPQKLSSAAFETQCKNSVHMEDASTRYNKNGTFTTSLGQGKVKETSQRRVSNLPAWMTQNGQINQASSSSSESQSPKIQVSGHNFIYSSFTSEPKRVSETNITDCTSTSGPVAETSQRAGISNLPAWMTSGESGIPKSQPIINATSPVMGTPIFSTDTYFGYGERSGLREPYLKSSKPLVCGHGNTCSFTSTSSEQKTVSELNSAHNMGAPRPVAEASQFAGISDSPAWMTNNGKSDRIISQPIHGQKSLTTNLSTPSSRFSFRNSENTSANISSSSTHLVTTSIASTANYRNNISYSRQSASLHHDASLHSKPQHDNSGKIHSASYRKESEIATPVTTMLKETSARKGISNLPAWMTTSNNISPPLQKSTNANHTGCSTSNPTPKRRRRWDQRA